MIENFIKFGSRSNFCSYDESINQPSSIFSLHCDHRDKHTQSVLVSNIELLLNYCNRFYDRQFYTRAKVNADVVQRFEALLKDYFNQSTLIESGLPAVTYFASKLNLSAVLSIHCRIWRVKTRDAFLRLYVNTNPHSPAMWRVNGPLMSLAPFYIAFDVQPGDKNYKPEDQRIKIW